VLVPRYNLSLCHTPIKPDLLGFLGIGVFACGLRDHVITRFASQVTHENRPTFEFQNGQVAHENRPTSGKHECLLKLFLKFQNGMSLMKID
jgi:hypothetical protein